MKSPAKKVYLETFGCQMNVSDSERVKTNLIGDGYQIVTSAAAADVVILNTCSVREKAEQKLYHRIGRIRHARGGGEGAGAGKQPLIGVMGCVAQLEGETLLKKPQRIDFVVGTQATGRVSEIVSQSLGDSAAANTTAAVQPKKGQTAARTVDLGAREEDYDWSVAPSQRFSPHVAFVPIIEGCNKFCTYCIVPFSRGREQSRTAAAIVTEVSGLREQGIREVHLIGQNVNSYRPLTNFGLENFRGATPFVKLLRAVAATGLERIKFTTSFPRDFHAEIVSAIDEHENLCNWVHLPAQSGSDRILQLMRRGHSAQSYLRRVAAIKKSARAIALTSDLIVGFPGETEADFAATLRLVAECEYDGLYTFKFSPRPGTPAAALPDGVSEEVKQNRFIELEQVQRAIQKKVYENYLGRTLNVLAEKNSSKSDADLSGHSTCQKVVNFACGAAELGKVVPVLVTQTKLNSLYGTIVG